MSSFEAQVRADRERFRQQLREARERGREEAADEIRREASIADRRRSKIAALAEQGATEGERAAARAALSRLDHPTHAENDRMQRGGNYVDA